MASSDNVGDLEAILQDPEMLSELLYRNMFNKRIPRLALGHLALLYSVQELEIALSVAKFQENERRALEAAAST